MMPARRQWLATLGAAGTAALGSGLAWPGAPWAATPGVDAPPEPLPPRPVRVPPMPLHRLGNGLAVVTVPRPGLPIVSARLVLRAGMALDPPGRPGVAAMTATLLAKGARRHGRPVGAAALAREVESLGAVLGTDSGWRGLGLGLSVMSQRLPAALSLMADVLREPLFSPDELERARAQALDGLRLDFGSPSALAGMAMRRAFWGDSPYGAVAPPAALQRLTVQDIRQFHTRHARPEQCVLVLAGDVTPERAATLAQQCLGDWPPSGALTPGAPVAPARPQAAPQLWIDLPGSGQAAVQLAVPSGPAGAPDRHAALVANALLGGGYSSRLNEAVRIRRGLSYGAFSELEAQPGGGMLVASTQVQPGKAAEALGLMRAELQRLVDAPPPAAELAARQAWLVGGFVRRLETTASLAQLATDQWLRGRPLAELQSQVGELQAVTAEQVQAYARRWWADGPAQAVVVGDLSTLGAAPPALPGFKGPVQRLGLAQLDLEQPSLMAPGAMDATEKPNASAEGASGAAPAALPSSAPASAALAAPLSR